MQDHIDFFGEWSRVLKKIITKLLVLAITILSLTANAAAEEVGNPVNESVQHHYEITLMGTYLQANVTNLDYATIISTSDNFTDVLASIQTFIPNYHFDVYVGLEYFLTPVNSVIFGWTHYNHSDSNSTMAGPGELIVTESNTAFPSRVFIGVTAADADSRASSKASFNYNAFDLSLIHISKIQKPFQVKFLAGLRLAQITDNIHDHYETDFINVFMPSITFDQFEFLGDDFLNSRFSGIGPRIGADMQYSLTQKLDIFARFNIALLIGKTHEETNSIYTVIDKGPTTPFNNTFNLETVTDNTISVVPNLDTKLGLAYSYPLKNQTKLTFEAGYAITEYFNCFERLRNNVSEPQPGSSNFTPGGTPVKIRSNFGLYGPYAGFRWRF